MSKTQLTGNLFIFSAVTFWLSWYLMPAQGTADTEHILDIVKQHRSAVYGSVILQVISSVCYIPALVLLVTKFAPPKHITLVGIVLLIIGAMGMCADAFFHLLAYFMTDTTVRIGPDVVKVMDFMQTSGLFLLIPLLLPFFIGSLILSIGIYREGYGSRMPIVVIAFAFAIGIIGGQLVNRVWSDGRNTLVLTVLGLFALSQILMALQIVKGRKLRDRR